MTESTFKIRERTVVIFGPIGSIVQTLATVLQEHGTDVAFLDREASKSHRFIANLMDMRQIHHNYGRAAAIDCDVSTVKDANDALSRAAELFGSVDILIDVHLDSNNFNEEINPTHLMTNAATEFFIGRGKGRNIFLSYENAVLEYLKDESSQKHNKQLHNFIVEKHQFLLGKQITSNGLALPFTDELVLKHYANKNIQEAMADIKKVWPRARLVEPVDIAYTVAFLASPISAAIDGQVIHASYGMNN
ncbi:MAG: SDR family oxidoreductase [Bdellovibrionaceae bacterium]|nr:SDR family oxidoreductase [Pseudobdellovibrionaceae bacterium]